MAARGTGRGRRVGLTREKVIAAAVAMIDRDGPDAFSLRKLATELDIENMSLYNHVPNKEALLDGVAEALLAGIAFPEEEGGSWQKRIRAHAAAFRAAAKRHPKAFPLVLTRPTQSPAALEAMRSTLACLDELRLAPEEMVHVLRGYTAFMVGSIMRELGYAIYLGAMDSDQVQQRTEAIAASGDPILTATAPYLADSDHDAEFQYGLELMISGLAAKVGVPYEAPAARISSM
ncbi:TetR/AcrR family transcriptional regulator C-terminal domain-containing protein [Streptomyces sp. GMR22]|uniref:TetR/AcrR family transcriptional regulator C-terminal domain-containing protein n=1 Tax=Streptomyces sp. GMR22 TaxID=2759524 RepID=UPI0015F8C0A8|nr:TetR/AcrR family transcriptional regulator C-terminal domain-containing protein [Streptomyces sp. GMR22]MBA6434579.1 TetR/AcrR family transcriptional regulator C-terminal domain-containing protein [Streptomyces sp. GMR22]